MKKTFLIFLLTLITISIFADEFIITQEIKNNPNSVLITRLSEEDQKDVNGNTVGLVVIRTGIKGLMIDSAFKNKQEYKGGEYHVTFMPGTKYFTFKKEGFGNLKYNLRDKVGGIESSMVYEMALTNRSSGTIVGDADLLNLTINLNQSNVFISKENSSPVQAKSNIAVYKLPAGKYKFTFSKTGYENKEEIVELISDKTIDVILNEGQSEQRMVATGFATIKSEPEGAEIMINGQKVGITPYTVDELFPGEYELTLRKNLYHSYPMTFTLKENETFEPETIKLKPKFGYISFNSHPTGAKITLDNKPYGQTPTQKKRIESGNHIVKIEYDLYHDYIEEFIINDGDEKFINAELEPAFGELVIKSYPEDGADVYIDNASEPAGKTPYTVEKMPSGTYNIRITKDLWSDAEEEVTVDDGMKSERTLILTKNFGTIDVTAQGATIYLDGKMVGKDSYKTNTTPGKYLVRAEKDRHKTMEKEVFVSVGQVAKVDLAQTPIEGVVSIKCQDKDNPGPDVGADLYLNGKKMDKT